MTTDGTPGLQMRDRVIVAVARTATRAFYRDVEVTGAEVPPGPAILAVSHLNGFVDPVVLIAEIGHLPRFLAKATLWTNPAARVGLGFARVIPVHRAVDGSTEGNAKMFASAVEALEHHGTVAVFAEGTTHDDPTIRPIRTGVARIALQAAGHGVDGLVVVPIGITYDDKVALRGRVLVHVGEPVRIPVDPASVGPDGSADHERVRQLTDHLQSRIEALTPHFASTEEALALTAAAEVTLRPDDGPREVPMAPVAATARRLAAVEPEPRRALVSSVARYEMLRGFVGLDDATVVRGVRVRELAVRVLVLAAIVTVLSPLAVAGLFANLLPLLLVAVVGLLPRAPVSKGTIRVLVGVVTFPLTWLVLALADAGDGVVGSLARAVTLPVNTLLGPLASDRAGGWAALAVLVGAPLMGIVALVTIAQARRLVAASWQWRTFLDRRGQLDGVRARRDEVVATTRSLLDEVP